MKKQLSIISLTVWQSGCKYIFYLNTIHILLFSTYV